MSEKEATVCNRYDRVASSRSIVQSHTHTLITSECSEPRMLVGPSAVPLGVLDKGLTIHKTSAL